MNHTTDTTYTVGVRVWEVESIRGAKFVDKVLIVYGNSEEDVIEKVLNRFPIAHIKYIEKSF